MSSGNQDSETKTAESGFAACWSCRGPVAAAAFFCHVCGAIQPPRAQDPFDRLGFEPRFDLVLADLDKRYTGFQRNLHPDRFARKSPKERAIAESQAMSLNEAYEALKDPVKRAATLLRRAGRDTPTAEARTIEDPELLMEAMEAREALADAADLAAVDRLAERAAAADIKALADLTTAFAQDDWDAAVRLTTRLRYGRKLAEEIRGRRAVLRTE